MSSMLPSPPKSMGKLSDVLISALASVMGKSNGLALPKRKSVLVILVDGLGLSNLKQAGAHAGFLNSQKSIDAACYYPSTTASSIVSFATGKSPWEHNFIGYQVYDRATHTSMNLLSGWKSQEDARLFQPLPTVSEMASDGGIEFDTIAPAVYERSGFTAATMRGAKFHGLNSIEERFEQAKLLLSKSEFRVVYLYIPELDQIAHSKGWKSAEWSNLLEDVDAQVAKLVNSLPKNSGVILSSDHGIIDIPKNQHIYLDAYLDEKDLHYVGGDTRGLFLYLKDSSATAGTIEILNRDLGHSCYVVAPADLIESGYWSLPINSATVPDFIVLAKKNVALYHRAFAKIKSLEMVGHHGSISNEEMTIPLITFGF